MLELINLDFEVLDAIKAGNVSHVVMVGDVLLGLQFLDSLPECFGEVTHLAPHFPGGGSYGMFIPVVSKPERLGQT